MSPELIQILSGLPLHTILLIAIYILYRDNRKLDAEKQELLNKLIEKTIETSMQIEQVSNAQTRLLGVVDAAIAHNSESDAGR